jgi:hypothetical protein
MREYLPLRHPQLEPTRGAGLWALALIAGGWVTMRALFIIGDDGEVRLRPFPNNVTSETLASQPLPTPPMVASSPHFVVKGAPRGQSSIKRKSTILTMPLKRAIPRILGIGTPPPADWRPNSLADNLPDNLDGVHRDYMGQLGPLFLAGSTSDVPINDRAVAAPLAPFWIAQSSPKPGRFSFYAYLFYRPDAAPGATATTYGGSQLFVRADWRLGRGGLAQRSLLYARVSRDMTNNGRTEFVIGGAVRPFARLPVTLYAERRVREHAPDATAAFVSGGVSGVALPLGVTLNAYGQGGAMWPDTGQSSPFFDGQASLTKPVFIAGPTRVNAGAMAATGGQDKAARLDIGPVVTVSGTHGGAQLQGQVGWRFRIAGDAAPANGPAVTVSFGF